MGSGANVERFQLDFEDSGLAEKAERGGRAFEGLASGMSKAAGSMDGANRAATAATGGLTGIQGGLSGLTDTLSHNTNAAGGNTKAHEELGKSFGHAKGEMREFAMIGEHLTGIHTGLGSVIRMALTPEFLAFGVAALAVGKLVESYTEHCKEMNKVLDESVVSVRKYGESLVTGKQSSDSFSAAQQGIVRVMRELENIEQAKKTRELAEAIEFAKDRIEIYNMQLENNKGILGRVIDGTGFWQEAILGTSKKLAEMKEKQAAAEAQQKLLNEAHDQGFASVEQYTASLQHWSEIASKSDDIVRKITPAEKEFATEVGKLNAELAQGAINLLEYNKRLAELGVIANEAGRKIQDGLNKKGEEAARKHQEALQKVAEIMDKVYEAGKTGVEKELDANDKMMREVQVLRDKGRITTQQYLGAVAALNAANEKIISDQLKKGLADRDKMRTESANKELAEMDAVDKALAQIEHKEIADSAQRQIAANNDQLAKFKQMVQGKADANALIDRAMAATDKANADILIKDLTAKWEKYEQARKKLAADAEQAIQSLASQTQNKAVKGVMMAFDTMKKVQQIYEDWKQMRAAMQAVQDARGAVKSATAGVQGAVANTVAETPTAGIKSYNAMANIPYIGPILGFAAAAAAIAYGMKAQGEAKSASSEVGNIGGAAGGGLDRVPRDMTMLIHEGEGIVPRDPAQKIRDFVDQKMDSQGGGDVHVYLQAPWYGGRAAVEELKRGIATADLQTTARRRG